MARRRTGEAAPAADRPGGRVVREEMVEGVAITDQAEAVRRIDVTVTEGIAASDAPAIDLDAWTSTLFRRTMLQVERQRSGDAVDRADEEVACRDLRAALEAIRARPDGVMRDVALSGIAAALSLGFHHTGAPEVARRARSDAFRERNEAAKEASRNTAVWNVIAQRADEHWKRMPAHQGRPGPTAREIVELVAADLQALSPIPDDWIAHLPLRGDDLIRYTNNIIGMLKRNKHRMTVSHP